jgi:membrane dipeptidase
MLIIDGDYPMAYGALDLKRDLRRRLDEVRAAEANVGNIPYACLPEMRRGNVAVALVKVVARIARPGNPLPGYANGEIAFAIAQANLAYYRILEKHGEARILTTRGELASHMDTWQTAMDTSALPVGFILGMEGADPILWPELVHDWWADGLRVISLAHYGVSTYAHGTGTPGGLLPPSKALLREMDKAGMILDMTHTSDDAFWQALDLFNGPVLASHQNCRALVPGERQFSDEQLRAILARGAVIGVSMDTWMLYPEGHLNWSDTGRVTRRERFPREAVTVATVVDHIDHICQLAGNAEHAAIGGDTDGQGGVDGLPWGIDTVADYQRVAAELERRGYSQNDIASVMHANWRRFYETWLPA